MSDLTVREYAKTDWPMLDRWWREHTSKTVLIESVLPPVGVVVEQDGEPVAALWVYLSVGVGIAFIENPVTKPGLTFVEASEVMGCAMRAIEAICKTHDYGMLRINAPDRIARWLQRNCGFNPVGDRVQLVKFLT